MNKNFKVLISAYACEPNKGSEPSVGWFWVNHIAKSHKVWVITRSNNREIIENEFKNNPLPNIQWVYIDLVNWAKFWKKGKLGIWLYYTIWQLLGYFKAKSICKKEKIDIAHHVSFMSFRLNFIPFLGIPNVVGPVGGLQILPKGFYLFSGRPVQELIRTFLSFKLKYSFMYRFYLNKINKLILANKDNVKFLPQAFHHKVEILQIGSNFQITSPKRKNCKKVTLYWGGILKRWKGLEIALKALRNIDVDYELLITGKGEDEKYFKKLFAKHQFPDRIKYLGWIKREKQQEIFYKSDIFLFTSLHETTGAILLEAMSFALPSIVIDYGGPGEIVTEDCGIKIKPINHFQVVNEFQKGIKYLANNPDIRNKMGQSAIKRIRNFYSWDKKAEFINNIYQEVLTNR